MCYDGVKMQRGSAAETISDSVANLCSTSTSSNMQRSSISLGGNSAGIKDEASELFNKLESLP